MSKTNPSLQEMLDTGVDSSTIENYGYLPPHRLVGLDMDKLKNILQSVGSDIQRLGGKSRSRDLFAFLQARNRIDSLLSYRKRFLWIAQCCKTLSNKIAGKRRYSKPVGTTRGRLE